MQPCNTIEPTKLIIYIYLLYILFSCLFLQKKIQRLDISHYKSNYIYTYIYIMYVCMCV